VILDIVVDFGPFRQTRAILWVSPDVLRLIGEGGEPFRFIRLKRVGDRMVWIFDVDRFDSAG